MNKSKGGSEHTGVSGSRANSVKTSNVIDLKSRRPMSERAIKAKAGQVEKTKGSASKQPVVDAPVLDMTERRNQIIGEERRRVRRTILTEFVGAFVVIPDRGLQRVALYDISDNGVAFDLDMGSGQLKLNEEVAMRVYLNQTTYFSFVVTVANARAVLEENVQRHGASFVKGTINDEALHHFVRFIETVSASLQTDHGDVMVSNLGR